MVEGEWHPYKFPWIGACNASGAILMESSYFDRMVRIYIEFRRGMRPNLNETPGA